MKIDTIVKIPLELLEIDLPAVKAWETDCLDEMLETAKKNKCEANEDTKYCLVAYRPISSRYEGNPLMNGITDKKSKKTLVLSPSSQYIPKRLLDSKSYGDKFEYNTTGRLISDGTETPCSVIIDCTTGGRIQPDDDV